MCSMFLFFKQKTAYERRISDWSSDVCSSDLPNQYRVDRDFVFLMASYDIDPGAATPKIAEMTDFNMWTWNSRVFPGIDSLPVRQGDRVRIRMGNLTMTNHQIGRASWRERGWQYGELWGGAVSLKKKKKTKKE